MFKVSEIPTPQIYLAGAVSILSTTRRHVVKATKHARATRRGNSSPINKKTRARGDKGPNRRKSPAHLVWDLPRSSMYPVAIVPRLRASEGRGQFVKCPACAKTQIDMTPHLLPRFAPVVLARRRRLSAVFSDVAHCACRDLRGPLYKVFDKHYRGK